MLKKIGLILFIIVLVGVVISAAASRKPRPENFLHQLAQRTGGRVVLKHSPNRSVIYSGLPELARHSDIIIVGRALGHRARLRADGNFLTEDFLIRVQEVLKGDLQTGRSILVSLPGGSYEFSDKSLVTIMPVNYRKAEDGGTYVFFLKKQGAFYKGHLPAAEAQGLFQLTGGKVQPSDLITSDPVVMKYGGMGVGNFLAEVRKAAPLDNR